MTGLQVAQLRLIFILPRHLARNNQPTHLAYIEWFTPFQVPDADLNLFLTLCATCNHGAHAQVIPLHSIACSCHLVPKFGTAIDPEWNSLNVLEKCQHFFLNRWITLRLFYALRKP